MARKKPARKKEPTPKRGIAWPRWTGFRGMTVRDWLPIVGAFLIPVMIAGGTWGITWQQGKIEDQRAKAERELAEQRAQDEALQAYLDQMSQLILQRDLLESEENDPVYILAQARTSTVIRRLNAGRNESAIRFLSDSGLARSGEASVSLLRGIALENADLSGANLREADLREADLSGADLSGAVLVNAYLFVASLPNASLPNAYLSYANLKGADLSGANLNGANLHEADLSAAKNVTLSDFDEVWSQIETNLNGANLSGADLSYANLKGAFLNGANLSGADLRYADLISADLSGADLSGAHLFYADLRGAFLSEADLSGAGLGGADLSGTKGWTARQLAAAESLTGATMPNGQKYEDWLKDQEGGGKEGENNGPS